jgi:hypothetical protein
MNQSIPPSKDLESKVINLLQSGEYNMQQISDFLNISHADIFNIAYRFRQRKRMEKLQNIKQTSYTIYQK